MRDRLLAAGLRYPFLGTLGTQAAMGNSEGQAISSWAQVPFFLGTLGTQAATGNPEGQAIGSWA